MGLAAALQPRSPLHASGVPRDPPFVPGFQTSAQLCFGAAVWPMPGLTPQAMLLFQHQAAQVLLDRGWWVPGGCSGAAQGVWAPSPGRLQSAGTYHHLVALQPSAGGGGGLNLSRRLGWAWTRGLWGCSELGLEVKGPFLHPAPAPDPQRSLEQPKMERKMAFIVGCQPHAHPPCPGGITAGTTGPSRTPGHRAWAGWWDVGLFMQPQEAGAGGGDSAVGFSAWPGREAPGFWEGKRHR